MWTNVNFYETPPYPLAVHVVCECPLCVFLNWNIDEKSLFAVFFFTSETSDKNWWKNPQKATFLVKRRPAVDFLQGIATGIAHLWAIWLEIFFFPIISIIPYNFDFLNFFFTWLLVPPASIGQNVQYIKNLQFWIKWLEFKILHIILIIPYNFDFLNFFAPSLWLVLRLSAWARTLWVWE